MVSTPSDVIGDAKVTKEPEEPVTTSPAKSTTPTKKKRKMLEDDFFSLSSFSDKKSKKKSKSKSKPTSIPILSSTTSSLTELTSSFDSPKDPVPPPSQDSSPPVSTHYTSIEPPPPVDKEALRSQIEESFKQRDASASIEDLKISDDEQDLDISFINGGDVEEHDDMYSFSEENERKRLYIIKVITKLPVPFEYDVSASVDFGVKGTKSFGKILDSIIEKFHTQFAETLAPYDLNQYNTSETALIWVEGKMEIKPFFKPSTLRIAPPQPFDILANEVESMAPTYVTCILIPTYNVPQYLSIYPEFQKIPPNESKTPENEEHEDDESLIVIEDDEPVEEEEVAQKPEYFVIGLKGKDNKRVEVEVSPDTQLSKLITHYLEVKKIDPNSIELSKVKLIFDDEVMDLSDTVGNTELEEDFEVQVVF